MSVHNNLASVALACTLVFVPAAAPAGSFNCSVIYDEFESLMNKRFLSAPDEYVQTLPGRISQQQFEGVANADFHLYPAREKMGIGILTSNLNIHAKFLFHWAKPVAEGSSHVVIEEIVKYGRVEDGYAPTRMGPFRLKPGMAIDIDSGDYVQVEEGLVGDEEKKTRLESGDLKYVTRPDGAYLESVNGAQVQFPLDTMCQGST